MPLGKSQEINVYEKKSALYRNVLRREVCAFNEGASRGDKFGNASRANVGNGEEEDKSSDQNEILISHQAPKNCPKSGKEENNYAQISEVELPKIERFEFVQNSHEKKAGGQRV